MAPILWLLITRGNAKNGSRLGRGLALPASLRRNRACARAPGYCAFRNGFSLRGPSQLTPFRFLHNQRYVTLASCRFDYPAHSSENKARHSLESQFLGFRQWACGAAGSALPWHGRGRRFDPDQVHHISQQFRTARELVGTAFPVITRRLGAGERLHRTPLASIRTWFKRTRAAF